MHLYFFLRGKFEQIELWKTHSQAAYWKWRRINKETGKEEITLVQGALRPSVFGAYEYIFPKEALAEVCSFFGIKAKPWNTNNGRGIFGIYGKREIAVRKMFACKKIPNQILKEAETIPLTFTVGEFERGVSNCLIPGVAFHVIGIKEDTMIDLLGYHQEGL